MPRLELNIEVDCGSTAAVAGVGTAAHGVDQLHVIGTVKPEDGQEFAFVGWVGLLALVQQALTLSHPTAEPGQ